MTYSTFLKHLFCIFLFAFTTKSFSQSLQPDYSQLKYWASHPSKKDSADAIPQPFVATFNDTNLVDVFFIHPTSYTKSKVNDLHNAPIDNEEINYSTDKGTMYYQASAFNNVGRIYCPRYRQAHLTSYWMMDKALQKAVFDTAYQDVKNAFEYYLKYENKGRPIIIASHSQGTNHATRLLQEFFDEKPLREKLVVAYLVGMPVLKKEFKTIAPCQDSSETGCFCTWRTFKYGSSTTLPNNEDIACTNPLSWKCDEKLVPASFNQGGIVRDFYDVKQGLCDAKVEKSILWVHKPKFKGSMYVQISNYHIADYNLFYMNIKNNAHERLMHYLKK